MTGDLRVGRNVPPPPLQGGSAVQPSAVLNPWNISAATPQKGSIASASLPPLTSNSGLPVNVQLDLITQVAVALDEAEAKLKKGEKAPSLPWLTAKMAPSTLYLKHALGEEAAPDIAKLDIYQRCQLCQLLSDAQHGPWDVKMAAIAKLLTWADPRKGKTGADLVKKALRVIDLGKFALEGGGGHPDRKIVGMFAELAVRYENQSFHRPGPAIDFLINASVRGSDFAKRRAQDALVELAKKGSQPALSELPRLARAGHSKAQDVLVEVALQGRAWAQKQVLQLALEGGNRWAQAGFAKCISLEVREPVRIAAQEVLQEQIRAVIGTAGKAVDFGKCLSLVRCGWANGNQIIAGAAVANSEGDLSPGWVDFLRGLASSSNLEDATWAINWLQLNMGNISGVFHSFNHDVFAQIDDASQAARHAKRAAPDRAAEAARVADEKMAAAEPIIAAVKTAAEAFKDRVLQGWSEAMSGVDIRNLQMMIDEAVPSIDAPAPGHDPDVPRQAETTVRGAIFALQELARYGNVAAKNYLNSLKESGRSHISGMASAALASLPEQMSPPATNAPTVPG